MRHLVILNPAAAKGLAAQHESEIRRLAEQYRLEFELARTTGPMNAAGLAQMAESRGFDVVVAAGGDGTCNEVVNGVMAVADSRRRPAVGVLCVGRGNDFAFGAGIPHDLEEGVRTLSEGKRKLLDVGRLSGCGSLDPRYFCNGIGVGFDTIVGLEAARMQHIGSSLGYVLGALKTIVRFPEPPTIHLRSSGHLLEREAVQISVMIGRRMGGTFYMAPHALSDDGELDLTLAGRVGRGKMIRLFFRFMKGTQEGSPDIHTDRSSRFEITATSGRLLVHADGETVCTDGEAFVAECVPGALEVVTVSP